MSWDTAYWVHMMSCVWGISLSYWPLSQYLLSLTYSNLLHANLWFSYWNHQDKSCYNNFDVRNNSGSSFLCNFDLSSLFVCYFGHSEVNVLFRNLNDWNFSCLQINFWHDVKGLCLAFAVAVVFICSGDHPCSPSWIYSCLKNASSNMFWLCSLSALFVHVILSVLSITCASIEEFVACKHCYLNSSTKTLAFPMAISISSIVIPILEEMVPWSVLGSVHIPCINFSSTMWSYASCSISHFLWLNFMLYQYAHCFLEVFL